MPVDTLAEGEQEVAAKPGKERNDVESDSDDQVCYCFSVMVL